MTKQDMKKEIRKALVKRYGFGPALRDITLLEASEPSSGHTLRALFGFGGGQQYRLDEGTIGEVRGRWR